MILVVDDNADMRLSLKRLLEQLGHRVEVAADGNHAVEVQRLCCGGVASLLTRRVLAGEIEQLRDFLPEIGEFALTPYLGAAEARRIISER